MYIADMAMAEQVIDLDNEVDRLYDVVKTELLNMAIKDKEKIDQIVDFLMIAKYLERIGDRCGKYRGMGYVFRNGRT